MADQKTQEGSLEGEFFISKKEDLRNDAIQEYVGPPPLVISVPPNYAPIKVTTRGELTPPKK